MNKQMTFLSVSLLLSTAAYAGKIGPKSYKEALIPTTQTTKIQQDDDMTPENSTEKTEKPSWSTWDSLKHMGKSAPDKVLIALKERKLNPKKEEDYVWLAETLLYCMENPLTQMPKLSAIYRILKERNELPQENMINTTRTFLNKQIKKEKATLMADLINLMGQLQKAVTPILNKIDDTLKKELKQIKKIDSVKDLTVEKGKERPKKDKLTDEKIYKEMGATSFIEIVANMQEEVNQF